VSERGVLVEGVYKTYLSGSEKIKVLRNANLQASANESIAVVGASGCGKSTLLNLIGGLDRVDSGSIRACGYEVDRLSEKGLTAYRSRGVGFVFQFHYLLKDFTALENVVLPALMAGTAKRRAKKDAKALLERVRMDNRTSHFPAQLSGGERQRIALARALINNPDLVLADEPTGNLDEDHKAIVSDLLFSETAESGRVLILVTHSQELASRANRRLRLSEGQLSPI